ncbi:MAG: methionine sulfoxide reductase heme-binding subunit [Chloroflexota bacterium]|jgi:sulfoxide reductase heme-binding subunit YedZ|nr:methionine sulfoxide reductase heme-binding subunit [Chloroflexota bacterium]
MVDPHPLLAAATAGPSALWYATRGAGVASLLVLTASVVLGVGTAVRWEGASTPRFVTAALHRNLSLLSIVLVAVHVVTTVLDPFAAIGVRDVVVPFGAAYRPVWLGLGVAAFDVLLAVALSSVLRRRIGQRAWRLIHWAAYAAWPLAVVHGLGTGSDAAVPWMIGLTASCVAAVVLAVLQRLGTGRLSTLPMRVLGGMLAAASLAVIALWSVHGPFQPGWAARAGTPTAMLGGGTARPAAPTARLGPGGFRDGLLGTMVRDPQGRVSMALRDVVDPALTLVVLPPATTETLPVLTVARNGRTLCTVATQPGASLYAVCGSTRLTIDLFGGPGTLTGSLSTSGPLR